MPAQFGEHPLAVQRLFRSVVQNVDLPESQQDFTLKFLHGLLR
jgi:hypothetical protein